MSSAIDVFCETDATKAKGGLNVPEIKSELKKLGLPTTGTRAEMRALLCNHRKQKSQKTEFVESNVIGRLLQLLRAEDFEKEFDILSDKWFRSLPMERHRDTSWLEGKQNGEIYDIYVITRNKFEDTVAGRAFLHKIETGKDVPPAVKLSEKDIKKSVKYDPTRRIIFLEGKILETMAGFVGMKYEHGGMIDLKKSGLFDRAIFGIGTEDYIIPTDLLDFEVTFHTHPSARMGYTRITYDIPSEYDTSNLLPSNKPKFQVHVLFTSEAVYTLYSDPRKAGSITHDQFFKQAASYASKTLKGTKTDLDNYIAFLKKHGIYMFRHSTNLGSKKILWNWPENIPLYINPVEPVITLTKRIASRV